MQTKRAFKPMRAVAGGDDALAGHRRLGGGRAEPVARRADWRSSSVSRPSSSTGVQHPPAGPRGEHRSPRGTVALWVLAACAACGGAGAQAGARSVATPSRDPLVGAWWGRIDLAGNDENCPLEVEIFDDGTAEANFLSDDRPAAICSFGRGLALREESAAGPVVHLGGELGACLWRREAEALRLSCGDHDRPPATFEDSIVLHRRVVHERHGLAALVGRWGAPSFWGGADVLTISADGSASLGEQRGRVDDVGADGLRLRLGQIDSRCLVRATDDRLSLRCGARGAQAPASFVAPGQPTLVFRRLTH